MKRRFFLKLSLVCSVALASNVKQDSWELLEDVQNHLLPDASKIKVTRYLKIVSNHSSFDKRDLRFIFDGLKKLQKRGYKSTLSFLQKETILREFQKSGYGENWISTLLNYTLEALFSDPIYGGNANQIGWKSYNHSYGYPRPKTKFGKIDV